MPGAQKLGTLARTDLYRWNTSAYADNMKKLHRVSVCIGLVYTMSCNV